MTFTLPPKTFKWNGTRWVVTDPDLESGEPPFEPSTHLVWTEVGEIRLAALKSETILEVRKGRPFKLNDVTLGPKVAPVTFNRPFEIAVRFKEHGYVRLESAELQNLADLVDAEKLRVLALADGLDAFQLGKADQWIATIADDRLPVLLKGIALPWCSGEPQPTDVRWLWLGSARTYFALDAQNRVVPFPKGLVSANRLQRSGVVLNEPAPDRARIHADGANWLLELLDRDKCQEIEPEPVWCYLFAADNGAPVPVYKAVEQVNNYRL